MSDADLDALVERLEELVEAVDQLPEDVRRPVLELLDGLDLLHRSALHRLAARVGHAALDAARADGAVAWLLDAYDVRPPQPVPVQLGPPRLTS